MTEVAQISICSLHQTLNQNIKKKYIELSY